MQIYLPIAEFASNVWILLAMGLAVGILSGIFGIGGGFILTPMLIFIGVPAGVAVGTGASLVVASSVSGALAQWRRGNIDLRMGLMLLIGGGIGTTLGVRLQQALLARGQLEVGIALAYVVVLGIIGGIMVVESALAWRKTSKALPVTSRRRRHLWAQGLPLRMRFPQSKLYTSIIPILTIGAFVGVLTAVMGVGGGFVLVPALIYLVGISTRLAIGTALLSVTFVTMATTVLQAVQNHTVDLMLGTVLMVSASLGAQYGVIVGEKLPAEHLRGLLGLLVLMVALRMAGGLFLQPEELHALYPLP